MTTKYPSRTANKIVEDDEITMKCEDCGAELNDWQIKNGYKKCLKCYRLSKRIRRGATHEV